MEQIEKVTGKQIIRIETHDLDAMEEVCLSPPLRLLFRRANTNLGSFVAANEEGTEVIDNLEVYCY